MRDAPESRRWEQPSEAPSLLRFAGFILDLDASTPSPRSWAMTSGAGTWWRVRAACAFSSPGRVASASRDMPLLDALRQPPASSPSTAASMSWSAGCGARSSPIDKQPRLIVTVPGEGYRFDGLAKSPFPAGVDQGRSAV